MRESVPFKITENRIQSQTPKQRPPFRKPLTFGRRMREMRHPDPSLPFRTLGMIRRAFIAADLGPGSGRVMAGRPDTDRERFETRVIRRFPSETCRFSEGSGGTFTGSQWKYSWGDEGLRGSVRRGDPGRGFRHPVLTRPRGQPRGRTFSCSVFNSISPLSSSRSRSRNRTTVPSL